MCRCEGNKKEQRTRKLKEKKGQAEKDRLGGKLREWTEETHSVRWTRKGADIDYIGCVQGARY